MSSILRNVIIATLFFSCNSSKQSTGMNKLTTEDKSNGWQLLFDGSSTKGWHNYGGGTPGPEWTARDGSLCVDTSKKGNGQANEGGDIVTDEEYGNFDLQLEWNISKGGNSGIIFYIHEDKAKYPHSFETGPEMQVLDNNGHPDAKIIKHRAGDLYDLVSCSKETVKPYGEWNLAEIKSLNGKLDLYLNGENVVSTTLWDENWKKLVAGSKFKNMPAFGTYSKGHIGLQDHGNAVCFRNIRIRKL